MPYGESNSRTVYTRYRIAYLTRERCILQIAPDPPDPQWHTQKPVGQTLRSTPVPVPVLLLSLTELRLRYRASTRVFSLFSPFLVTRLPTQKTLSETFCPGSVRARPRTRVFCARPEVGVQQQLSQLRPEICVWRTYCRPLPACRPRAFCALLPPWLAFGCLRGGRPGRIVQDSMKSCGQAHD